MLIAPMAGIVVDILVSDQSLVAQGQALVVIESMKMEHEVLAEFDAKVMHVLVTKGQFVEQHAPLFEFQALAKELPSSALDQSTRSAAIDSATNLQGAELRADLKKLQQRLALVEDAARPDALAKRHAFGFRSARENIVDLCDSESFVEFGALAFAAQTARRAREELMASTPADGIVIGIGRVRGVTCAVLAYDMTVLAGTQGMRSHQKTDRLLKVALERRLPVILFAEGGGGRPGDTDMPIVAGLHVATFAAFARLSGQVPLIGIVTGRCFAGNAALLGSCDVIISTQSANIGMGGPAMIEGGGLGVFKPEEVGPATVQFANGVVDLLVKDEAAAVIAAKQYLSLVLNMPLSTTAEDEGTTVRNQYALRDLVPENRLRSYSITRAIDLLFDLGSVQTLKSAYGVGVATALAQLGGRSVAVVANNPLHLGGAIDPHAADKLAEFLKLANRHQLPIVSLVDTPGFMVGPQIEAQAQVRFAAQLFVVGAQLTVPIVAVVLRKGYGLGAMAMCAGGFHQTTATIAWPTAEFGAMGLEGAVTLGYRKELAACENQDQRSALFDRLLAKQYEMGQALRMAETLEIDAVIDPAHTRAWIMKVLGFKPS